ncbi:LPXTG cell wall anchor domain-containing protein [Brevibacterium sp. CFH 10365]|uniref:LPXTG cell wall anchor domain-containing protein n=1 Tax=Brevibacterium sp. CFH 10365 TaxID=2585207 RepID=UPI001D0D1C47|nr:LPXTG cell wall anchor domain-containing protein [Brevibacterium sp. CFH 10365]
MQKKLVQSSLALAAATALGLGSAFVAGPAAADQIKPEMNAQAATQAAKKIDVVNAFGFDESTKTLSLGVESGKDVDAKQIEELKAKYGADAVEVTAGVPEVQAYAGHKAVGGMGYLVNNEEGALAGACSTGFAGWDKATKEPIVLSAGHCAEEIFQDEDDADHPDTGKHLGWTSIRDAETPSTAPGAGGEGQGFKDQGIGSLGDWKYKKFGTLAEPGETEGAAGDIDLSVVSLDSSKYDVKPGATDWTTASDDDLSASVKPVTSVGSHTEGAIQKSGRTTGLTDGEVIPKAQANLEYMTVSGRWVHGFAVKSPVADPFSEPGDSGGGVFQGDTAVGVISGGVPSTTFVDEDGNPVGDPFALGWVADLDHSLTQANVDITFEDPNEEPEAPAAPTVSDQTIEPKGEITGKAVAGADVKVTWTGAAGGEATAKADDSGNFTLEGPGTEGDYDAKAVATVDGQSSEAASFKVTVKAADDSDGGSQADGADGSTEADGNDGGARADGNDGNDGTSKADGDDADASAAADGKDDEADSDADGDEKPEAPKVGDQTVVEGGKITGKAAPNAEVKLTWKPAGANAGSAQAAPAEGTVTVETDADGNFSAEAPAEAGDYNYTAVVNANGQTSAATQFVVTVEAEEAPVERSLTVDPKEISASDFVKEDKGVQITAEGFEEGEQVSLEVVAGPDNVEGITLEETANADGVVGFSIYGTSASSPEAYLGKYDLEVTGANDTEDEEALTGSFEVVADEDGNGGGDDGDDNGNDDGNGDGGGSDLPRTGAELTGLAAGAGLLLVGGAAVVLTMRRKKNN